MKTIVLVGGGHSHVYCVKMLKEHKHPQMNWILLSNSKKQYYSGMFSGFTEGLYAEEDTYIDLEKLAINSNATFVEATVLSVDPIQQKILCSNGEVISYDILSLDIGSTNKSPNIEGLTNENLAIKPNEKFPDQIHTLRQATNPVIIGGGAAGIEMALSLLAWQKKYSSRTDVTLLHSAPLLKGAGEKTSQKITQLASKQGLKLVKDRAIRVDNSVVYTAGGSQIDFDTIMYLGGPHPPDLIKSAMLPTDEVGFLLVNSCLQTEAFPNIFGAGDCITISDQKDMPKNGVNAVRQGPILFRNIMSFAFDEPLESYTPKKADLAILSTGFKEGFFLYGRWSFHGKWAWFVKNFIDRRFMDKYRG
ncbi:FAD-dependent oxidoreductase [Bacillus spongiae]|uniref:FAD-dependent oxidoreductase n=1 Tax=Bacillus spongiae TaxID=2683610 RepID=A0ABU8HJQ8_9BACI